MNYPDEILPNNKYKLITCDLSGHYLIRHTPSNKKEEVIDPDTNLIRQKFICSPREHMSDLSTSLLGIFIPDFIEIELTQIGKEKYGAYCDPDANVEIPIFETDFIINKTRGYWVILISNIHEKIADYTKPNISDPFTASCTIKHTPMLWNFWHFSIRWELENGVFLHELPRKTLEKVYKRLTSETRALVARFAKFEEPNYLQLNPSDYLKEYPTSADFGEIEWYN